LTPGNVEFFIVLVQMMAVPGVLVPVVVLDEKRLGGRELERAWPPSSRLAAFFTAWAFGWPAGCVALIVHFVKTRGSMRGVSLGVLWSAALYLAAEDAPQQLVPAVIDWLRL
jgi:hypothetical protein